MSKIIAVEHLTLDGVMQAPGRTDEDTRDGFAHGPERPILHEHVGGDHESAVRRGHHRRVGLGPPLQRSGTGRGDGQAHGRAPRRAAVRQTHLRGFRRVLAATGRQPDQRRAGQDREVRRLPHRDRAAALAELHFAPA
ncbi:hypothetical protein AB4305_20085 [Nocardia sp. 2YAB30]|uniref:hypothetical protein n=1 Tax=unclassified Nocardia TaxID=2637762 RepID=UPI003F9BB223